MYEAMEYRQEGGRYYTFKIKMGFFETLEKAKQFAKKRATGIPFVQIKGRCVWSPLHDKLETGGFHVGKH